MANFNLGSLLSWTTVTMGELYAFDVLPEQIRHVEFEFISDQSVSVTAVCDDNIWPLAVGSGHNTVKFTIGQTVGVVFEGDPSAIVCIKTRTDTQIIDEDGEITFTSIEPRGREVPDQMRRYMLMMNLNQQHRENAMRAEFEQRLAEQADVIERQRAPTLQERQLAASEALAGSADPDPAETAPDASTAK